MIQRYNTEPTFGDMTYSFNDETGEVNVEYGEPIVSFNSYKWILVCLAFSVIPGMVVSTPIFEKFGYAGGAVFGNVMTAVQQVALITVSKLAINKTNFGIFVAVLYGGFGFTFVSQISTG